MKIAMKNSKTGEIKEIKVGWSWTLFLFSPLFGLPLFLRKLNVWGAIFLALWIAHFIVNAMVAKDSDTATAMLVFLSLAVLGLEIFVGVKGNEMTAKNYLENGWVFVEPESDLTKMAKMKWGIVL